MYKLAFYGKGGIGKSTTVSNVSACLAERGLRVMQIGCDPKADSTLDLRGGSHKKSVMQLLREKNRSAELEELVTVGFNGVFLVEAGGPTPGQGCAGRGIIAALELLDEKRAYEVYKPDVVLFDVLGDVVCGGFSMPIREGYADQVFILTSGEAMSCHAAMNIAVAVDTFRKRGYASLGGIILNRRNVRDEDAKVLKLCEDTGAPLTGALEFSGTVQEADGMKKTVIEAFPDSAAAGMYRELAASLIRAAEENERLKKEDPEGDSYRTPEGIERFRAGGGLL